MDLATVVGKFPDRAACVGFLEALRWGKAPVCCYCNSRSSSTLSREYRHHCNRCNLTYSVTVDTALHRTHVPLQKWFVAIWLVLSARKNLSARALAREVGVDKNTACAMNKRIRTAMRDAPQRDFLLKIVEGIGD